MIKCYKCNRHGHIRAYCPSATQVQATQMICTQSDKSIHLPNTWILLDSCSSISSIANKDLAHDLEQSNDTVRAWTNGGFIYYNVTCKVNVLNVEAFYNARGIANILSMADVAKKYRVTMDTHNSPNISVHIDVHLVLTFRNCGSGIYYFDTDTFAQGVNQREAVTFFETVDENKKYYTSREMKNAEGVRRLQSMCGWPSNADLKQHILKGSIINCPYLPEAVDHGNAIYGPMIPLLKGKMVRKKHDQTVNRPRVHDIHALVTKHPTDELDMDYFFVNGLTFLHTKTKKIKKLTISRCSGTGKNECTQKISTITRMYANRGFTISPYNGDNDFRVLKDTVGEGNLNIVARREHVGSIERSIRTIKERCRCVCHNLPFKSFTKIMTEDLVVGICDLLNSFPARDGISVDLSPDSIVLGKPKLDYNSLKLTFGAYAHVFDGTDNTMKNRTVGAIALRPSNEHGSYYFMSLQSGRRLNVNQWKDLPITQEVIDMVHSLVEIEGQNEMPNGMPTFEWEPGMPIDDQDYTSEADCHVYHEPNNNENDVDPTSDDEADDASDQSPEHEGDIKTRMGLTIKRTSAQNMLQLELWMAIDVRSEETTTNKLASTLNH